MPTKREAAQLLGWERMAGPPMVRIKDDRWRPGGIDAWFLVGNLLVHVEAEGTPQRVRVRRHEAQRLPKREADALATNPSWSALRRYADTGHIVVGLDDDDWERIDVPAMRTVLEQEATVTYDRDQEGRVVAFAYGGSLPMPAEMVRRDLAGHEGPAKAGPKPKADPGRVRDLYLETGDVRSVAVALGLSTATVYRHLKKENL